jgi:hypothetical protein
VIVVLVTPVRLRKPVQEAAAEDGLLGTVVSAATTATSTATTPVVLRARLKAISSGPYPTSVLHPSGRDAGGISPFLRDPASMMAATTN